MYRNSVFYFIGLAVLIIIGFSSYSAMTGSRFADNFEPDGNIPNIAGANRIAIHCRIGVRRYVNSGIYVFRECSVERTSYCDFLASAKRSDKCFYSTFGIFCSCCTR